MNKPDPWEESKVDILMVIKVQDIHAHICLFQ